MQKPGRDWIAAAAALIAGVGVVAGVLLTPREDAGTPAGTSAEVGAAPQETLVAPESARVQPAAAMDAAPGEPIRIRHSSDRLLFEVEAPGDRMPRAVAESVTREMEQYRDSMIARAPPSGERWTIDVDWRVTAQSPELTSLIGSSVEDTGGPHPNLRLDGVIARSRTGERLALFDLFQPDRRPSPALAIAICEGLKAAKIERIGEATVFDEPLVCAGPSANTLVDAPVASLLPSTVAGKFGGVTIHYPPYAVGPYSEGGYEIEVTQDVFAEDLSAEFRGLFEGSPR